MIMNSKIILGIAFVVVSISIVSSQNVNKINLTSSNDTIAYVIGANIGTNLKKNMDSDSLKFSYEVLMQGFKDALNGIDSILFTQESKQKVITNFQKDLQQSRTEKMAIIAAPNKEAGNKFLDNNKKLSGVIETASGLQYKIVKKGKGKIPSGSDQVTVNYEGKLLDGTIFDSSFDRQKTETFFLKDLIKGWVEGLQLMKEGGSYELYVKSDLAYGDNGTQSIPGGSLLIFKIDLIKIEKPATNSKNTKNN